MRVSEYGNFRARVAAMGGAREALDTTQKQLASGHRFSRPGEDPAAMSRLVRIERYEGDLERYRSNIDFGEGMINTANDAYQAIIEVLNDARTTANMMADSFQNGERQSQAETVQSMLDSLKSLANTQFDGLFVFGGHLNATAPYVEDPLDSDNVAFVGDAGVLEVDVGEGSRVRINHNATVGLNGAGGGVDIFALTQQLRDALSADDQGAVQASLDEWETAIDQVTQAQSDMGANFQRLQTHKRINEVFKVELERTRSSLQDTDFAEAASELSLRQTAYEASLASSARVQGLSLLNYM
ncbi:MAG TPA: hypothetical protein DEB46_14165 [Myxococcales bacterium]|nr:hypothetical protein [Myxococcales bacterium]HBU49447.1 hypothetical protein [Myxococcales bacterium]